MSYFVVDIKTDGHIIGINSLVCFGAVLIDTDALLDNTFYGKVAPVSDEYTPEILKKTDFTRDDHESFDPPEEVFAEFQKWIMDNSEGRPIFILGNTQDFSWMNWYFYVFLNNNPFGRASVKLTDLYSGFHKDINSFWKEGIKVGHVKHPVEVAKLNAEVFLDLVSQGLNIDL